jgi:AhpD family alkylhydroperoxidase
MTNGTNKPGTEQRFAGGEFPKEIYRALSVLEQTVNDFGLEKRLLGLLKVRASQLNGCAYCLDMHWKEALRRGETSQRLYSLPVWKETSFYSPEERSLLAWTDAITLIARDQVPDELYQNVLQHFEEGEIAKYTLAIIAINSWNRWMIAVRKEPGSYQLKAE